MKLKRHKNYKNDESKAKLSDTQYAKYISWISLLLDGKSLPPESLDHNLVGEYKGFREFHIGGDMLVIYTIIDDVLYLVRLGTHAQLFR